MAKEPSMVEKKLAQRREWLAEVEQGNVVVPGACADKVEFVEPGEFGYAEAKAIYIALIKNEIAAMEKHIANQQGK